MTNVPVYNLSVCSRYAARDLGEGDLRSPDPCRPIKFAQAGRHAVEVRCRMSRN